MPQMSPIYWMLILLFIFVSFILLIIMINCFLKDYNFNFCVKNQEIMLWNLKW